MASNDIYRKVQNIWDKSWKDSHGHVVLWQMPNKWLLGWAAMTVLSLLFSGRVADVLSWIGSAALITWSLLEITQGVNYFRRALGLLVLVFSIASLVKSL